VAYLKAFVVECSKGGCSRVAKVEVFNAKNASCGRFCPLHGKQEVDRLAMGEKQSRSLNEDPKKQAGK